MQVLHLVRNVFDDKLRKLNNPLNLFDSLNFWSSVNVLFVCMVKVATNLGGFLIGFKKTELGLLVIYFPVATDFKTTIVLLSGMG